MNYLSIPAGFTSTSTVGMMRKMLKSGVGMRSIFHHEMVALQLTPMRWVVACSLGHTLGARLLTHVDVGEKITYVYLRQCPPPM